MLPAQPLRMMLLAAPAFGELARRDVVDVMRIAPPPPAHVVFVAHQPGANVLVASWDDAGSHRGIFICIPGILIQYHRDRPFRI